MKTINIKGKEYVTVNERIKAFRSSPDFKGYSLETELVEVTNEQAIVRAVIRDCEGRLVATGTAHERVDQKGSLVNATSHVENCETSAWGRALGNLGIGVDTSICTADELILVQNKKKYDPISKEMKEINELCEKTKTDKSKLYDYFSVIDTPTPEQIKKMKISLEKKMLNEEHIRLTQYIESVQSIEGLEAVRSEAESAGSEIFEMFEKKLNTISQKTL